MVDKEEIKLEVFADDVTAFLRNNQSLEVLLHTADLFSKCSGLEINAEKTECVFLGNQTSSISTNGVISSKNIRVKNMIKILGVNFTYNESQRKKLNFDEILKLIKEKLRILGLQPRDRAAMLVVNIKEIFWQNLHQNRVHFPAERNAFVFDPQHGRRDVTYKPAMWKWRDLTIQGKITADFKDFCYTIIYVSV